MTPFQKVIVDHGREFAVDPGQHVFRQGDRDSHVYFVQTGLLKAYYLRTDGKEHIKSFLPEGAIIASMVALTDDDPCTFSLVALERGSIVALPYLELKRAAANNIELANALIDFLSVYGKRKERREFELLSLSPEERFRILHDAMPDVADRVSQADLAGYIGVTPQALSRIKRRLK